MDFQTLVDSMGDASCIVSVEDLGGGAYGKVRIVTGNRKYLDTIERPYEGLEMLTKKFVPNSEYTNYLTRDLNFENSCYQAAVMKKCLHSYAHPARYDVWFNMSFLPVEGEEGNLRYCMYVMEVNLKPDAKRMSNISPEIASAVLETCIKLRSPENFRTIMTEICKDIRDLCDSEHCCIFLMDTAKRSCSVLSEAFSGDTKLLPMDTYVDDKFYDIAESWEATIGGSNCLIVRNEHDMEAVREINPVWFKSMTDAGAKNIILFPLEFKNELLGYIWTINFSSELADTIKETLEMTTFILSSEIYSFRLLDRLQVLSSKDMLTGVMNRNEMNNYVDELAKSESGKTMGVVFADLNGLKVVNDSEGHIAGDTLLKNAAAALNEVFSTRDIFRAGGDEFVVLIENVTEDELAEMAAKLKVCSKKYDRLRFAIGTALALQTNRVREALRIADERMYEDKKAYYERHPERKRRHTGS
ncbi:GGDEF domain-containing protein [uncultured Ruminococcus sp.]|uniref:sensor domain-containing diguanylate cyclase n=1 Tax=uncultured Ruminococcus sp. TaxID=165186 RepID=UPI0025ECC7DD|nr:GGDEF domain-containing protein [uncultured Ruminococcus sp.]